MPKPTQDVTDAELAVLESLWENGPATIRELADSLYDDASTSQYATVQKLLERLEGKRCVKRDRRKVPHRFRPNVAREDLIDRSLQDVADRLCEGSLSPLLSHLVTNRKLTNSDVDALRDLVDQLDQTKRRPSR